MQQEVEALVQEIEGTPIASQEEAEAFRLRFLSRNGLVQQFFGRLKEVPNEQKRAMGQILNGFKMAAEAKYSTAKEALENATGGFDGSIPDLTLPGIPFSVGSRHPLTLVRERILEIFKQMGFAVATGPEIETEWYNFSALNFADNHPAREMQDTFFVSKNPDVVLRTHTSPVQIRVLEQRADQSEVHTARRPGHDFWDGSSPSLLKSFARGHKPGAPAMNDNLGEAR